MLSVDLCNTASDANWKRQAFDQIYSSRMSNWFHSLMSCNLIESSFFNQSFVPSIFYSESRANYTVGSTSVWQRTTECVIQMTRHKLTFHDIWTKRTLFMIIKTKNTIIILFKSHMFYSYHTISNESDITSNYICHRPFLHFFVLFCFLKNYPT